MTTQSKLTNINRQIARIQHDLTRVTSRAAKDELTRRETGLSGVGLTGNPV